MLKVISFTICPFVQRVTAMLEAKELPYEVEYISLKNKPQWFLDISPNAQVPVLVIENGTALFESDAIVEYLDDIAPPLEPSLNAEQRALNRAWSYLGTKHYLPQCGAMSSRSCEVMEERKAKLDKAFGRIKKHLGEREGSSPFFGGDSIGNVDIAWLPLLHRFDLVARHSGFDFLEGLPQVKAWQKRLLATGLAERSVSENFEQKFVNFIYLRRLFLVS